MFCRFCGKENNNQARFCTSCGQATMREALNNNTTQSGGSTVNAEMPQTNSAANHVGRPMNEPFQNNASQNARWGLPDHVNPQSFDNKNSQINQNLFAGQPINQNLFATQRQVVNPTPQNSYGSSAQGTGLFSSPPDVHQVAGKPKKRKWLIPVLAGAAVLIVGAVVLYSIWPSKSPEKRLQKALISMVDSEGFMLLPSLKNDSKKAFSLAGDFSFDEFRSTADFELLYDKEGKQIQLTAADGSYYGETIFEDENVVYLTPDILALYTGNINKDFSYLKVDLDTLTEDWNESDFAEESGFEIPEMDIKISEYVDLLFNDMTPLSIEDYFDSDENLKKIYDEFMNSVDFKDEGKKDVKIAGETISTSVMSYTISEEALETFMLDYMDFATDLVMESFGDLFRIGYGSSYNPYAYLMTEMEDAFDMLTIEDITITFFIDSSDKIRRIELPFEMSVYNTNWDEEEVVEASIQLDLMGEKYPLDSFELTIDVNGEEIVIEREGIRGESENTDYLAISDGGRNSDAFMTYEMTWDKEKNSLEMEIATEYTSIFLEGGIEVTDDKISLNNMTLTNKYSYWDEGEVDTVAEFSLEIGYVDAKEVFHDVNDNNSKSVFDFKLDELEELFEDWAEANWLGRSSANNSY